MGFLDIFKKKSMDVNLEELKEDLVLYDYQWIKGDNIGNIEIFKNVSLIKEVPYIEFQDGGRIKLSLLDEFLIKQPISTRYQDEIVSINQNEPIKNDYKVSIGTSISSKKANSAVYELLKKQKENFVDINITLKLNIPSKDLYNVLCTSFENANDEIVEFSTNDINIDDIKKSVALSLNEMYSKK